MNATNNTKAGTTPIQTDRHKIKTTPGGIPKEEIELRMAEHFGNSLLEFWSDYYETAPPLLSVEVNLRPDLSPTKISITTGNR